MSGLGIVGIFVIALAACGSRGASPAQPAAAPAATCADVAAHYVEQIRMIHRKKSEFTRWSTLCTEGEWSVETRPCMVAAASSADWRRCASQLAEPQRVALEPEPVDEVAEAQPDPGSGPDRDMGAELIAAVRTQRADAITALLADDVLVGGLWFPDAACTERFGAFRHVTGAERSELARCLARLTPQATARKTSSGETLLTYEPGVEADVMSRAGRVTLLGFPFRRDAAGRASLTVRSFEALRKTGTSNLDAAVRGQLDPLLASEQRTSISVWMEICIDRQGVVERATRYDAFTPTPVGTAFEGAVRAWTFRPFESGGKPTPACSVMQLTYPAALAPSVEGLLPFPAPPPPPPPPPMVHNVPPTLLEGARISGNRIIMPEDETKGAIQRAGIPRVTGSFKLCIDATGAIKNVTVLKPTGFVAYDQKIQREIWQWAYRPYHVNGKAVAVCTAVTYIYSQRDADPPKPTP